MKRKILVGGLALFVLMAAMVSIVFADDAAKGESKQNQVRTNQKTEKRLSKEQVKQIAAEKVNGTIEEIELEREKNNTYYEVEINDGKKEHELKIDAKTGEIYKHEQDRDDWNDDDDDDRVNKNNTQRTNTSKAKSKLISAEEASSIAVKTVNGRVLEIELERDNGRTYYEVEMREGKKEHELKIDAVTGEVFKHEQDWNDDRDDWNDDDDDDRVNKSSNIISSNNASNIAAKTVDGRVLEIELDEDDGRLMYEVELWTSKGEAEVEIDAYTGKVLSVEYDD